MHQRAAICLRVSIESPQSVAGTVVEVTEVVVEPPLADSAPAFVRRIAICSTFENATICARQKMVERSGDDYALLYYVLDMIILGAGSLHQTAPTAVFDGSDKLRGMIPGDVEKPWGGRPASECRYSAGDLVGFVCGDVYRVGIVLALPPSPEESCRGGNVTLGDDLYLVGVLDGQGRAETNDHEHVAEPMLFAVEHDVAAELRAALERRFGGYQR